MANSNGTFPSLPQLPFKGIPIQSLLSLRSALRRGVEESYHFVRKNSRVLLILAAAVFLFYWYEIRPVRIHRSCAIQSSIDARSLLKSKSQITTDVAKKRSYESLLERNMYLRSDYESFYGKCLGFYGMSK